MDAPLVCAPPADLGKARRVDDAAGRYIEFCKSTFPERARPARAEARRRLRARRRLPRGTAGVPRARRRRGRGRRRAERHQHQRRRRGDASRAPRARGARARCRPRHRARRRRRPAADGRRATGALYDGDQLLYVIARDYQRRGALAGGVVGTLMTNLGFEQALAKSRISLVRARVGDRYVLEQLLERGWQLGGENSGHLICLDKHTTGDAIVAALPVLRALIEQKTTLAEAAKAVDAVSPAADQRTGAPWLGLAGQRGGEARRARRGRRARRYGARAAPAFRYRAGAARHGRGARAQHGRRTRRGPRARDRQGRRAGALGSADGRGHARRAASRRAAGGRRLAFIAVAGLHRCRPRACRRGL